MWKIEKLDEFNYNCKLISDKINFELIIFSFEEYPDFTFISCDHSDIEYVNELNNYFMFNLCDEILCEWDLFTLKDYLLIVANTSILNVIEKIRTLSYTTDKSLFCKSTRIPTSFIPGRLQDFIYGVRYNDSTLAYKRSPTLE